HQEPLARLVVPRAEWVAIAAGSVAAGLFVFGLTAVLVEELELQFFGSQDFIRLFNLNHELSVPATVSSLGLAACALLLALITAVRGALRAPFVWHWGLLALIFLYLAVDEGA